jgi:hypothetical protein
MSDLKEQRFAVWHQPSGLYYDGISNDSGRPIPTRLGLGPLKSWSEAEAKKIIVRSDFPSSWRIVPVIDLSQPER